MAQKKTRDEVAATVYEIVAKAMMMPPEPLDDETTFDELNADSLDRVEIAMDVEEAFLFDLPDETMTGFAKIGELVSFVHERLP